MKTTIDLPDELLADARAMAERRGWTVRLVFEESLRAFLEMQEPEQVKQPVRLKHTAVQGVEFPGIPMHCGRRRALASA